MTITDQRPGTPDNPTSGDTPSTPHWSTAPADSPWIAAARALVPELAARADEHDRDGTFVQDGFDLLREHGLHSMLVPSDVGGGGATHAETCAALAELAHGCSATSLSLSMHTHLVAAQTWRHHRDLPAPALGRVANEGLWLISTGASDWLESSGTATQIDGGYRVSARKQPASGCPAGNVLVTSVRWDDAPDGPQVIHCSIPFSADGVSIEETWDTMGMRGTGSHTVVVDDVFVPDAAVALVRPAGEWHPVWATVLGVALPLIMSSYVGVAERAVDLALGLVAQRHGSADRPDVDQDVGRMLTRLTAAQDTVGAMITTANDLRFDNTIELADLTLRRKTTATDACIDAVRLALELGGGAAYARSAGIERLFRDVHGALYHPLPAGRQAAFSGRRAR